MVLAEPKVVILDEATSALDAATEYNLHQALARFLSGRTTLIIAHRLSAVKQADRVLVFDGGHVAEDGDHQQLIAEGGLYAKLYGHLQQLIDSMACTCLFAGEPAPTGPVLISSSVQCLWERVPLALVIKSPPQMANGLRCACLG
jgi:ABC-type microcin C transport system duplicated ATPase subunit YejF